MSPLVFIKYVGVTGQFLCSIFHQLVVLLSALFLTLLDFTMAENKTGNLLIRTELIIVNNFVLANFRFKINFQNL